MGLSQWNLLCQYALLWHFFTLRYFNLFMKRLLSVLSKKDVSGKDVNKNSKNLTLFKVFSFLSSQLSYSSLPLKYFKLRIFSALKHHCRTSPVWKIHIQCQSCNPLKLLDKQCYSWIECMIQQIAVWLGLCVSFETKSIRAAWCKHSTVTDFALQSKNVSFLNTSCSIFVCLRAILYSYRFEWLAHSDGYSAHANWMQMRENWYPNASELLTSMWQQLKRHLRFETTAHIWWFFTEIRFFLSV